MSEPSEQSEWSSRSYPIEEDMKLQRREWHAETIGWICLFSVLAAALLGVFSHGVLSSARAVSGPLWVEYERFVRFEADHDLRINFSGSEVLIGPSFFKSVSVTSIVPPPAEAQSGPRGVGLRYASSDGEPMFVDLGFRATAVGLVRTKISAGGSEVSFWQLVYP